MWNERRPDKIRDQRSFFVIVIIFTCSLEIRILFYRCVFMSGVHGKMFFFFIQMRNLYDFKVYTDCDPWFFSIRTWKWTLPDKCCCFFLEYQSEDEFCCRGLQNIDWYTCVFIIAAVLSIWSLLEVENYEVRSLFLSSELLLVKQGFHANQLFRLEEQTKLFTAFKKFMSRK